MLLVVTSILCPGALAQPADEWRGEHELPPNRLRSDFVIGAAGGLWTGNVTGTLNEAEAIGNPELERGTGFGAGSGFQGWIGLPVRDYFTFAIGGMGGSLAGSGREASGGAFLLRLEGYPLIARGGIWERIGLTTMFGAGWMTTLEDSETVAEGGALSLASIGGFWEAFGLGGLQLGPELSYTHMFSQTMSVHLVSFSARVAFYTAP